MKVQTIQATLRLSRETDHGWATVELGAEAALEPGEVWHEAQGQLYQDLKGQLARLFANNGRGQGPEKAVAPPEEAEPAQRSPPVGGE